MAREVYQEGSLQLTIEFALERQGWVLDLTSPPLWETRPDPTPQLVHTQIVIPLTAYEQGAVDEYLDALLAIHFDQLGLLYTGW
jgi:hypothetical protein